MNENVNTKEAYEKGYEQGKKDATEYLITKIFAYANLKRSKWSGSLKYFSPQSVSCLTQEALKENKASIELSKMFW